jgi:hypothetical protein
LPGTSLRSAAEWPCTSAEGDSTRSISAGSSQRSPLSKLTVRRFLSAETRNSVGLEFVDISGIPLAFDWHCMHMGDHLNALGPVSTPQARISRRKPWR